MIAHIQPVGLDAAPTQTSASPTRDVTTAYQAGATVPSTRMCCRIRHTCSTSAATNSTANTATAPGGSQPGSSAKAGAKRNDRVVQISPIRPNRRAARRRFSSGVRTTRTNVAA